MPTSMTWLVLLSGEPMAEHELRASLVRNRLRHVVIRRLTSDLAKSAAPELALVHAGGVDPKLLDAVDVLGHQSIPTMVALDLCNDLEEDALRRHGVLEIVALPAFGTRLDRQITEAHRRAHRLTQIRGHRHGTLENGALSIDIDRHEVRIGSSPVSLTKTEFDLLAALAHDPSQHLTREELARSVRGRQLPPGAVESHLSRTRAKLLAAGGIRLIDNRRGRGYRLGYVPPVADAGPGGREARHPEGRRLS